MEQDRAACAVAEPATFAALPHRFADAPGSADRAPLSRRAPDPPPADTTAAADTAADTRSADTDQDVA